MSKWDMRSIGRRRILTLICSAYLLFWLLTATWGIRDIDGDFDEEFATGLGLAEPQPVVRLHDVDLRNPYSPGSPPLAEGFWRCRTHGIPVAPFVVLDEAGAQWASMAGIGGRRIVFWFFGWTKAIWIQRCWLS